MRRSRGSIGLAESTDGSVMDSSSSSFSGSRQREAEKDEEKDEESSCTPSRNFPSPLPQPRLKSRNVLFGAQQAPGTFSRLYRTNHVQHDPRRRPMG